MPRLVPTPAGPDGVRDRILAAALDELATRGLDASSVRTIARRAGVTPAMINYYFGSKRALYDTVVADAQGRLLARLDEALAGGASAVRLAAAYFDFLVNEGQLQRLLLREVMDGGGVPPARMVRRLRRLLAAHFGEEEAAVQGALSLFGAIAGYFIYAPVLGELLGQDPLSPEVLARRRRHVIALATNLEESPP